MRKNRKRSLNQYFTIALIMTKATIKRLLFSKKTIGIIVLCLIPILIFGLWHAGVFEEEVDEIKLYATIPELAEPATDQNISVSIDSMHLEFSLDIRESYLVLVIEGQSSGPVDHLTFNLYLYFNEENSTNLISAITNGFLDTIHGPFEIDEVGLRIFFKDTSNNSMNNWSTWRFFLELPPQAPNANSASRAMAENGNDNLNEDFPDRFGIYVRAYSDNISSAVNWSYDYKEIYFEFDDSFVVKSRLIDKDVKEKSQNGYEVFFEVSLPLFFLLIIPLVTILYSLSAVREDIEKHTIVYLITRPISKTEIIFYKFKGFFISAWIPLAFSISISFFIIASKEGAILLHLDYLGTMLLLMTLTILAFGAIFFVFSNIISYPIVLSLLYIYFWETTIWQIPNSMSRISILYHVQCVANGLLGDIAHVNVYQPLPVLNSILVLIGVTIGFLVFAIFLFNYRDFE